MLRERFGAPLCLLLPAVPGIWRLDGRASPGPQLWSTSSPRWVSFVRLAATRAVLAGAWEEVFVWLGLALVIDGIDGTFARMADVTVGYRVSRASGSTSSSTM